jgi:sugar-specific transcriptional regulator TrmB
LEKVLKTLTSFGLNQTESQVYIFLAKKGPHIEADLADALNMPRHQTYQCLRNLKNKGIISASPERPATYSAMSFEKALDLLIKAKLKEVQITQQNIQRALSDWQSVLKENHTNLAQKHRKNHHIQN